MTKLILNSNEHKVDVNKLRYEFKSPTRFDNSFISLTQGISYNFFHNVKQDYEMKVKKDNTYYSSKTVNTLHERFYGPNGHLNPSTKKSALLEHIGLDVHPLCEFNTNKIKIIDACNGDLKLRFAESIHLKHSKQTLNTQERSIPLKII